MSSLDGSIGNETGVVSGFGAVSNDDWLDLKEVSILFDYASDLATHVSDQAVWSWFGGSPKTEVIDTVERYQPRDGCLVDV